MNWGDSRLPERFWRKVSPCPMSGCWLWTGAGVRYGIFWWKEMQRDESAHRVAYAAMHGGLPAGLVVDHRCSTPLCCNPSHLRAVTQQQNVAAGRIGAITAERNRSSKGRPRKTHCPKGHEYTPDNTYQRPSRYGQACVTCRRENGHRYNKERRERECRTGNQ